MTTHKRLLYLLASGLLLFSSMAFAQVPYITYNTPINIYTVGTAITPLIPTNTGGAVPVTTYSQVATFAGSTSGTSGTANSTGTAARFKTPSNIVEDGSGNFFVADLGNNEIRKITAAGVVTTFAGSTTGAAGYTNATGTAARFSAPAALCFDGAGNLYVTEQGNNAIRKITSAGVVTTFAGSGAAGSTNGTGTAASFNAPAGIAIDGSGNLYVAEQNNNDIRKITPGAVVSTFAGSTSGTAGYTNATGTAARFSFPAIICFDGSGNMFVTDWGNNAIREITSAGVVTTFAGSTSGTSGSTNGTGTAARFSSPAGIAIDGAGNFYISEYGNNDIRMITPAGVVTLLAGSTTQTAGTTDAVGTAARFNTPIGMCIDATGTIYLTDYGNNSIRTIGLTGYTISPALPTGLTFTSSTGTISGTPTPTAISPATNYTITGFNASGSSSFVISIACGVAVAWTAGGNSTAWATPGTNWSPASVPGVNDAVSIGVSAHWR